MKPYPSWFKRGLVLVASVLFATGLLLIPTLLSVRAEIEVPWRLPGDQRVLVAAVHVGLAMLSLTMVGALWTVHMRAGWRKHRQRVSGALLCTGVATLALSALVLHYAEEEATAALASWVHLGVGVLMLLPFVWHGWLAHRPPRRHRGGAHHRH